MLTTELINRAQAGDGEAFRELTDPYRRELQVHCYRMLGSVQDAEDLLQDTLLAAWQGLDSFEGRASIRTWLYRIATNRCLNALRSASRRPAKEWDIPNVVPPEPTKFGEVVWLEPYPDALLESSPILPGPEARYEQSEAISLAFVTALQLLPARQRAVLILREVLGYHASEVADMLDSSVESVTSALKRARAGLRLRQPTSDRERRPAPHSPVEQALVVKFVRAYEAGDVMRSSPCLPTTCSSRCRRIRSSTTAAMRSLASAPSSCAGDRTIFCRRARTVSPRSAHTFVRLPVTFVQERGSSFSHWQAIELAG